MFKESVYILSAPSLECTHVSNYIPLQGHRTQWCHELALFSQRTRDILQNKPHDKHLAIIY